MIDFTTLPLYVPLPELELQSPQNLSTKEDNSLIKLMIAALLIGAIIYIGYHACKIEKMSRDEDKFKST